MSTQLQREKATKLYQVVLTLLACKKEYRYHNHLHDVRKTPSTLGVTLRLYKNDK